MAIMKQINIIRLLLVSSITLMTDSVESKSKVQSPSVIQTIAENINQAKNICFLTGAGVSVSAGIPDFRSAGGMYETLKPQDFTATKQQREMMEEEPTLSVSWQIFSENQLVYLELRRPFILGSLENRWKATLSHAFVKICEDKGILRRLYTQNIDGLDYQLGMNPEKIVNVHGTMGKVQCGHCNDESFDRKDFADLVRKQIRDIYDPESGPKTSTSILCKKCGKAGLKPATTLYGEGLPNDFFAKRKEDFPKEKTKTWKYETKQKNFGKKPESCDMLIVAGTSLTIFPAAGLVEDPRPGTKRILVNRDLVGKDVGFNPDENENDIFASGNCDNTFLDLIIELGWQNDLMKYFDGLAKQSQELITAKIQNKN